MLRHGMKRLVKRAFRTCGYELRRIHANPSDKHPGRGDHAVDPGEIAELMRDLETFARAHPDCMPWADPRQARTYLTNQRIAFFHDLLQTCRRHDLVFDRQSVADVGSGTGYLLRLIQREAPDCRLVGYDTYAEIRTLAETLCPTATFVPADLFAIRDVQYDVVLCTEVLEHLKRPDLALAHLLGLVRSGGRLVLTVPNGRTDQFPVLQPLENGQGYWGHINFWSPESWAIFIEQQSDGRESTCGSLVTGENYAILRA